MQADRIIKNILHILQPIVKILAAYTGYLEANTRHTWLYAYQAADPQCEEEDLEVFDNEVGLKAYAIVSSSSMYNVSTPLHVLNITVLISSSIRSLNMEVPARRVTRPRNQTVWHPEAIATCAACAASTTTTSHVILLSTLR